LNELAQAIRLAVQAHNGQLDKAGQPSILHVLRVGAAGATLEEQILGFLHDVLEDTDLSPSILQHYFSPEINIALAAITREPGETYRAYIERAGRNPLARAVKIKDLLDNLSTNRDNHVSAETHCGDVIPESLKRRYNAALEQLNYKGEL
jgi:hypothetical protein